MRDSMEMKRAQHRAATVRDRAPKLRAWVRSLAIAAVCGGGICVLVMSAAVEKTSRPAGAMRRLTHSQYNHTVRDLLGDQTLPANLFPQEDFVDGFKNQVQAQSISPVLAEAYSAAAEKLAANAFRGGDVNGLIPCRPAAVSDAACRDRFIREFGRKALRRPLTEKEVQRYAGLFGVEARRSGAFLAGAQVVVEAMLQAPAFLFRIQGSKSDQYARAGQLSYFLWDTMPDQELFRAAAAGELATGSGLEKQVRRMLRDPHAREAVDEFVSQWLRFDRVLGAVRDRRTYPRYTPELGMSMTEETRRLAAHLVWSDRNFMELFTADYGFLSSDLAALYRLPRPAEEFGLVRFPPDADRAGILGGGTFLTLTSKPEETSPTARGLFIREQFLCQQVPSPPPGTNMNLPPLDESKPQNNRDRLLAHQVNPNCRSCHAIIDPIGFGLEKFDAIGQRRDKQTITFFPTRENRNQREVTVHAPIDPKGMVAGIPNSEFSSPKELGALLAANEECQRCVVKQLFRYAFGRREVPADRPVIDRAFRAFRAFRDSIFQSRNEPETGF